MEALNTFLTLVSKTQGRDKVLRLFQYICVPALDHKEKEAKFKVYEQMRITRKMLRFLRTLQYLVKIKSEAFDLTKSYTHVPSFIRHVLNILCNLFTLLYFLADHKACLSELNVISPQSLTLQNSKSLKFYTIKTILAILHNICCMIISNLKSKDIKQVKKQMRANKHYAFDLIRCVLDCLLVLYYWKKIFTAKTAGIIGVISTLMSITQCLDKM